MPDQTKCFCRNIHNSFKRKSFSNPDKKPYTSYMGDQSLRHFNHADQGFVARSRCYNAGLLSILSLSCVEDFKVISIHSGKHFFNPDFSQDWKTISWAGLMEQSFIGKLLLHFFLTISKRRQLRDALCRPTESEMHKFMNHHQVHQNRTD